MECFKTNSDLFKTRFEKHLNSIRWQWHWAKCFILIVFHVCMSVCRFVKSNICPKMCTLFCLIVHIKKRSLVISYAFWFALLTARWHLCFRLEKAGSFDSLSTKYVYIHINCPPLMHFRRTDRVLLPPFLTTDCSNILKCVFQNMISRHNKPVHFSLECKGLCVT